MLRKTIMLICTLPAILVTASGFSQEKPLQIPLWANGAPGFEKLKDEPEQAQDYWVKHINNPSITVFLPPKEKATGAAIIVCPGGGHRLLVYNAEGVEPAQYLNKLGVAVFVLKYRLARDSASPYSLDKHPKEDAYRAIRLVRSRAKEWGLDTNRIGIMGFSAGGEVVNMVAYTSGAGDPNSKDPVDKQNGRPNFLIFIYPGPLGVPDVVPADTPPAFLLAANDDACCSGPTVSLLEKFRMAKIPVEAHIYTQGNHAFNMGYRSKLKSIQGWPQRMADWLEDNNFLQPKTAGK
ncbi:MAG: 1,4-beta-xylanase [Bacteroidetes bacterium]|nr:MAG: 1,4-beta-xylanase [Bacteroidota bacterium]